MQKYNMYRYREWNIPFRIRKPWFRLQELNRVPHLGNKRSSASLSLESKFTPFGNGKNWPVTHYIAILLVLETQMNSLSGTNSHHVAIVARCILKSKEECFSFSSLSRHLISYLFRCFVSRRGDARSECILNWDNTFIPPRLNLA